VTNSNQSVCRYTLRWIGVPKQSIDQPTIGRPSVPTSLSTASRETSSKDPDIRDTPQRQLSRKRPPGFTLRGLHARTLAHRLGRTCHPQSFPQFRKRQPLHTFDDTPRSILAFISVHRISEPFTSRSGNTRAAFLPSREATLRLQIDHVLFFLQ
jgi:hypothetical protein